MEKTYFLKPSIKEDEEHDSLWSLSIWIFKSRRWALNLSQSSLSIFCLALNWACWLLYSSKSFSLFFQNETMFDISTSKSRNPRTNSVYLPSFSLSWYKDRSWKKNINKIKLIFKNSVLWNLLNFNVGLRKSCYLFNPENART